MNTGRRRYKRFRVNNMNIGAKTLFAMETKLLNMSVGGACINTEESLKETDKQLLRLNENRPVILPCSVVWERMIDNAAGSTEKSAPVYRTGVSFGGVPSDKRAKLRDFIGRSGSPCEQRASDVYRPRLLRFDLHAHKKAVMYYTKTLPVKKIGLGGMLAELHRDVQPGKVFLMEISIPNENPPIRFRGRIASRIPMPDSKAGCFDVGIEFLDMSLADKYRLSKFFLFSKIPGEKR
jgi:hypothetical protein